MIVYPLIYYIIRFVTVMLDLLFSPILAIIAWLERNFPDPLENTHKRRTPVDYRHQRERVNAIVRPFAMV